MTFLIASFLAGMVAKLVATRFFARYPVVLPLRSGWFKISKLIHRVVVAYLLVHIGLVGGVEMAKEGMSRFALPGTLSVGLALTMFAIALVLANGLRIADRETRISLATHAGSVSVGTFAATQAFLTSQGLSYDPSSAAWLTLMEIPSILVGAASVGDGVQSLKQTMRDRDLMLLLGSLGLGYVLGPALLDRVALVVMEPFEAILAYFLFDMGQHAGGYILQIRATGARLVAFGVLTPIMGGILGVLTGRLAGMRAGDVIILSVLCASASYVAPTAVMGKLVSPKAIATSLTVSLGVTLPWNILVGIPLYTRMALWREGTLPIPVPHSNLAVAFIIGLGLFVCIVILAWIRKFSPSQEGSRRILHRTGNIQSYSSSVNLKRDMCTSPNTIMITAEHIGKNVGKQLNRIFSRARDGPIIASARVLQLSELPKSGNQYFSKSLISQTGSFPTQHGSTTSTRFGYKAIRMQVGYNTVPRGALFFNIDA